MKRSDISDIAVVLACLSYHNDLAMHGGNNGSGTSADRLMTATGAPYKVAIAAMDRAYGRSLVEVGMGIDWAWPTEEGLSLLPADIIKESTHVARLRALGLRPEQGENKPDLSK